MDNSPKYINKIISDSEYRYALMNQGYEPYRVAKIESRGNHTYKLMLELDEEDVYRKERTQI